MEGPLGWIILPKMCLRQGVRKGVRVSPWFGVKVAWLREANVTVPSWWEQVLCVLATWLSPIIALVEPVVTQRTGKGPQDSEARVIFACNHEVCGLLHNYIAYGKFQEVPRPPSIAAPISIEGDDPSIKQRSLSSFLFVSFLVLWLVDDLLYAITAFALSKKTLFEEKSAISRDCKYSVCSFWESYQSGWW